MNEEKEQILNRINSPEDLKKLTKDELLQLTQEVRSFIVNVVSQSNGHLGASLGVVELTIALHYVFDLPIDNLVWDVGHQAYVHKIFTGRRDQFPTNRKLHGISGFPKMSESKYDAFGVGHSSTSISAVLGMAVAAKMDNNPNRNHIAVIGDGALTAGMAFEAINHGGYEKANILIILNDNGIAIDENVGALKAYFTKITASRFYNRLKHRIWNMLAGKKKSEGFSIRFIRRINTAIKASFLKRSNLFESFGFRYFGPVDGHDLPTLIKLLTDLKNVPGPKVFHCITTKGKGYEFAEKDQTRFHAPGKFDVQTGESIKQECENKLAPKYQTVFGKTIIELAEINPKIVGVTPAMPTGCSLDMMMHKMPHRAFDVGIAEQHAVTFSAGMATQGYIPFCNIYSTFMQRAYDQVVHDVALQKLNVVFCLDRGGLVGEDGPTHHGAFDLAYFRCIPDITIASPINEVELRNLMYTAQLKNQGTFVIRYPRSRGVLTEWKLAFKEIPIGKAETISEGTETAIITIGHVGNYAIEAIKQLKEKGYTPGHYNFRFLKPLDQDLLHTILKKYNKIITIEDGTIIGGLGSAIAEFMAEQGYHVHLIKLGIPDKFIEQGSIEELHALCGFDVKSIIDAVINK